MDSNTQIQIAPDDRDLAIRTMIAEEPTPQGQSAVASVILNRAQSGQYGGSSVGKVVLAPGQFEPWARNAKGLMLVPTDDPSYQRAAAIFDGVASGQIPDLTGGSTHFYAPKAQAALGRKPPTWAQGQGLTIGNSIFYAPNGKTNYQPPMADQTMANKKTVIDDPLSGFDIAPPKAASSAPQSAAPSAPSQSSAPASDDPLSGFDIAPALHTGAYRRPDGSMYWNPPPGQYEKDYPQGSQGAAPSAAATNAAPPSTPIGVNDTVRAMATGVPIIGGMLNKMDAATNAALAPVLNPLFSKQDQLQGDTFSDRYKNALAQQEGMDTQFSTEHPVANIADQLAGGVAGTALAAGATPALFGISKAPWYVNMIPSAATGGVLNASDAAIRSGGDLNAIRNAGAIGFGLGLVAPGAGEALGAGANALANTVARTTPEARYVAAALAKEGLTPAQAQAKLATMGPNATIADLGPSLSDFAGSLANKGGEPTAILKNAYAARGAGTDNRISDAVTQYLGPRPDLTGTEDAIKAQASKDASPFYKAAEATAGPMDVTPILTDIESKLPNAVGGVKKILQTAGEYLTDDATGAAKSDPQAILSVRQALDDIIEKAPQSGDATTAGKNAINAAKNIRGQVDALLKTDPNIEAGDLAYSTQMKNLDALNEGTDLFKKSTRIEDVNRSIAAKTPEQVSAMQQGALSSIHDSLDNALRGDFSAAKSLFAKSTANRAKLDALFPNSGKVFDRLDNEISMRQTESNVTSGSQTASRNAIAKDFNLPTNTSQASIPATVIGGLVGGAPGAAAADIGSHVLNATRNALAEARLGRLSSGVAKRLSAVGQVQDQFMREINRAASINGPTNALVDTLNKGANLTVRSPVDYTRNALWNSQFLPQGVGGSPN